jgi:hypothetical protein
MTPPGASPDTSSTVTPRCLETPKATRTPTPRNEKQLHPAHVLQPSSLVDDAVSATAQAFGTTPEVLLGGDRTRAATDARAVGMTAARMRGGTWTGIAGHSTVTTAPPA